MVNEVIKKHNVKSLILATKILKYKKKLLFFSTILLFVWFTFCLPRPLFKDPYSTLIEDVHGNQLASKIAEDEQWRFQPGDSLPVKFIQAITIFEDRHFFSHPGINPISLIRALKQNMAARKVVSGGSTISMQTIRLSRKGQARTFFEKCIEIILAIRMELSYSKSEILNLYVAHAPFGGNVVGLEAAAWRYYGRSPHQLSWGETAALAVLPNAPSLVYPGKNHEKLELKRNRLLDKLIHYNIIDEETGILAKSETLPGAPLPGPRITPHLLNRVITEGGTGKRIKSTIQLPLQNTVNRIVDEYHRTLSQNEIHNIAVLVLDVKNASVLAYVGNSNCPEEASGKDVDIITSARSTGSILKPFLYTFMLQDEAILPHTLIADIPTRIGGYSPKNFEESYDGMVPASEALARSLNIPAVRMLQDYGLDKFHAQLQHLSLSTIDKTADHYGLSLILGGAEAPLWDLANEYMKMAQSLNDAKVYREATFVVQNEDNQASHKQVFHPGAIWWTMEALSTVNRPYQETGWNEYLSAQKIAWKTGTSFGHRDAWAIGVTPNHVVGVWAGNADGEGRPGLTGLSVAAPILFNIFRHLKYERWFQKPDRHLVLVNVCKQSGFLASDICVDTENMYVPRNTSKTRLCPFHYKIQLDSTKQFRVNSNCYPVNAMKSVSWFLLPPVQEWYFKMKNPFYKTVPSFLSTCQAEGLNDMAIIYPKDYTKIFIPRDLDGSIGTSVFELAHRDRETSIYWHLDREFIGTTKEYHRMEIAPSPGIHQMTVVDERGETLSWEFEVLGR